MPKSERKKKSRLIDKAPEDLFGAVKQGERIIYGKLKAKLERLDKTRGKIDNSPANLATIMTLDRDILPDLMDTLKKPLTPYLQSFDEIERLNRLIYEGILDEDRAARMSRVAFGTEKTFIIDEVTRGLTEPAVIRQVVVNPIRNLLYKGVVFRQPISTLQANIRREVLSSEGDNSTLLRYTRQIAQDATSQYDGAINDKLRDEIDLDGFAFIGSVIATTRANCRELVSGDGKFDDLAVEEGVYKVSDLPEIIRRMRGRSGFHPLTTPQTFAQYRGGYGCRHEVIYMVLDDEQVKKNVKKLTQ